MIKFRKSDKGRRRNIVQTISKKCQLYNLPGHMKTSDGSSYFQKGQKSDLGNYGPISVPLVLSRLSEKIVHDQVSTFMKDHGLFSKSAQLQKAS